MKTWKCKIQFETSHVLSQETAQEFWSQGVNFQSSGAKTYTWVTEVGAVTGEAALEHAVQAIRTLVHLEGLRSPEVLRLSADRVEEVPE